MLDDAVMLEDYRLTTAEILYHLPDHPDMLQSYIWKSLDRIPDFPKLTEFLALWEESRDGALHSVRIAIVGEAEESDWACEKAFETLH